MIQFRIKLIEIILIPFYFIYYGIYSLFEGISIDDRKSTSDLFAVAFTCLSSFEAINVVALFSVKKESFFFLFFLLILVFSVFNYLLLHHNEKYLIISEQIERGKYSKFNFLPEILALAYVIFSSYTGFIYIVSLNPVP